MNDEKADEAATATVVPALLNGNGEYNESRH